MSIKTGLMVLGLLVSASIHQGCVQHAGGQVASKDFGSVDGEPVTLWTIDNEQGMSVDIMDYGATVTSLKVTDPDGSMADVVLGFDTVDEYVTSSPYFGSTVGRVGNRIANGQFKVDGVPYQVAVNNGDHHLHGGLKGYDKKIWTASTLASNSGPGVRFRLASPAGEEGYPGRVDAQVDYVLSQDNELIVIMTATAQEATPVNLLHHSYWNLGGHDSSSILDHEMMIVAERYTPGGDNVVPSGSIDPVEGTPFDFREMAVIGDRIDQLPGDGDGDPGGYDVNFVLDGASGVKPRLACILRDPASGRTMEIWTDQPGLQFYTGNYLGDLAGKQGAVYDRHDALCLETQGFPDAINHEGEEGWPSVILRPGDQYRHVMIHRFGNMNE